MGFWDVSTSPILGPEGKPERLLCVSRDITAMKVAQDELERAREAAELAARHDSLTGLLNRAAFREKLEQRRQQSSGDNQTAVLFLDLDEFKSVNDSLGHPAGDQLLCEAAERLRSCLRATDLIARFGGDEFAILQTAVEDKEQVESLARRLIGRVSEPYLLEGREVVVGVSIGVALSDTAEVVADDLLKKADISLYQAKQAGRGVYRFFESGMDEAAKEQQQLRSDLREAVARGEFRIVYQPVVEFETSRVTSFEALLRWQHPRRGLLSPADFISLAEATGDIKEIGDCVRSALWLPPGPMRSPFR
jgi:diguanylate cyclase (GGDEF)-like protein